MDVVQIFLPTPISDDNANTTELSLDIWDMLDRSYSKKSPGVNARNRGKVILTGASVRQKISDDCNNCTPLEARSVPSGLMLQVVR